MPTIIAPKPFINILRRFMRKGSHPGDFIMSVLREDKLTEACGLADDWNAVNLWHIGAIIREYVPMTLRNGEVSIDTHQYRMAEGKVNFDSLNMEERSYFNYMKDWDIPYYVQEVREPQVGIDEDSPTDRPSILQHLERGLDPTLMMDEGTPLHEHSFLDSSQCPGCKLHAADPKNVDPCSVHTAPTMEVDDPTNLEGDLDKEPPTESE